MVGATEPSMNCLDSGRSSWIRGFRMKELEGLFELRAHAGGEMTLPYRHWLFAEPGAARHRVGEHRPGHVLGLVDGRAVPGAALTRPVPWAVGEEDAQAVEDDRQVGEQLVVVFGGGRAALTDRARVGKFVGDRPDDQHRLVEAGALEVDAEARA